MSRRHQISAAVVALAVGVAVVIAGASLGEQSARDAVGPLAQDRRLVEPPPYDRDAFGRWLDADGDCQDTRNEVLARDLLEVVYDERGCLVLRGTLVDPYTGERVDFVRGARTSSDVQVDHVLPLRAAWYAGAHAWTDVERRDYSNDLDNLVATAAASNQAKGAKLPSEWAASVRTDACAYVSTVVQTTADWRLDLPPSEDWWIDGWYDGGCGSPLTLVS